MSTITSGHINTNGGVRGHSAGDIFPWRVMGQGVPGAITWHVVKPNGEKLGKGHATVANAYKVARFAYATWSA